jgi:hypothetical protein
VFSADDDPDKLALTGGSVRDLVGRADRAVILFVSGVEQPDLGLIGDMATQVVERLSAA